MNIGSLGDVVFSVSADTVKTFKNLKFTESAAYSAHAVHGRDAVPEFTGYNSPQITFEMTLSAFLGMDPKREYDTLREMMRSQRGYALALGTDIYGDLWLVTTLSRAFEYLYKDGTPISCKVNVTLLGMEG